MFTPVRLRRVTSVDLFKHLTLIKKNVSLPMMHLSKKKSSFMYSYMCLSERQRECVAVCVSPYGFEIPLEI